MDPVGCRETSVRTYQFTLRNIPEQRRSPLVLIRLMSIHQTMISQTVLCVPLMARQQLFNGTQRS